MKHTKIQKNILKIHHIKHLIMIPLKDEVVPRKPLIKLLKDERIKNNFSDKINILVYKESYHMILRDLNGIKLQKI